MPGNDIDEMHMLLHKRKCARDVNRIAHNNNIDIAKYIITSAGCHYDIYLRSSVFIHLIM